MRLRRRGDSERLSMTPMIDVVFLLLVFFILTLKPTDLLSNLDVSRPMTPPNDRLPPRIQLLTIGIEQAAWVLNGKRYPLSEGFEPVGQQLARIASFSRQVGVLIQCTADSPHFALIRAMDACAREGFANVAVASRPSNVFSRGG